MHSSVVAAETRVAPFKRGGYYQRARRRLMLPTASAAPIYFSRFRRCAIICARSRRSDSNGAPSRSNSGKAKRTVDRVDASDQKRKASLSIHLLTPRGTERHINFKKK